MACRCEFPTSVPVIKHGWDKYTSREAEHYCGNCGESFGAEHIGSGKYKEKTSKRTAPRRPKVKLHVGDCIKILEKTLPFRKLKGSEWGNRWSWYYRTDVHEYGPTAKWHHAVIDGKTDSWSSSPCICCERLDTNRVYHVERVQGWYTQSVILSEYNTPNKKHFEVPIESITFEKMPEFWNWKTA